MAAAAGGDDDDDGHTPISTYLSWFRWIIGEILMIRCILGIQSGGWFSFCLQSIDGLGI